MSDVLLEKLARWPAQREQRLMLDDVLGQPRLVDHFAFFKSRRAATRAKQELERLGFDVSIMRIGRQISIQATRSESLDDENVAKFLTLIVPIVEGAGGTYDGFGGGIVKKENL